MLLLVYSYSTDGMLITVDSLGIVRALHMSFGISWTPLLDMNNNVGLCVCVHVNVQVYMYGCIVSVNILWFAYLLCTYHIVLYTPLLFSYTQLTKKTDTFFVIGITCDPYEIKLV